MFKIHFSFLNSLPIVDATCHKFIITKVKRNHNFLSLIIIVIYYNVIVSFNARPIVACIHNLVNGRATEKVLAFKTLFFYNATVSPAYELTYLMEAYWGFSGIALNASFDLILIIEPVDWIFYSWSLTWHFLEDVCIFLRILRSSVRWFMRQKSKSL